MKSKKKIIVIEDQPLLNSMMQKLLADDFDVVATSTNAKDMMNLCERFMPDLILTDIVTQNGANGIKNAKFVKEKFGDRIKVLAITGVPEVSFLEFAKESKLDGLIYKDIDSDSLILSINQILQGYTLFPTNYVVNENNKKLKELTNKEMSILKLLCYGASRESIASELNITSGTLKNYISNILLKMGFDSISKLTMFCISNGYIVPDLEK